MWSPPVVASSLLLFSGKIQRGKRLKNAKVSAITCRHEYKVTLTYTSVHTSAVSTKSSMRPNGTVRLKLAKIRRNLVGGAIVKFAVSLAYCVLHLMQNWKTKLPTEKNVCK